MSDVPRTHTAAENYPSPEVFEFGVVNLVLNEYPETYTEYEVILRVSRDRPDHHGGVHEAIRELVSFGVLHREGERLHPTMAAIRVNRLADLR